MRLGAQWRGLDGTYYNVKPQDVKHDQPRWWIDEPPKQPDTMLSPATPSRLHTLPAKMFGEIQFALVLA